MIPISDGDRSVVWVSVWILERTCLTSSSSVAVAVMVMGFSGGVPGVVYGIFRTLTSNDSKNVMAELAQE